MTIKEDLIKVMRKNPNKKFTTRDLEKETGHSFKHIGIAIRRVRGFFGIHYFWDSRQQRFIYYYDN